MLSRDRANEEHQTDPGLIYPQVDTVAYGHGSELDGNV